MNDSIREQLKNLLGTEFNPEDLEKILAQHSQLLDDLALLKDSLNQIRKEPMPALDLHFTEKVMANLQPKGFGSWLSDHLWNWQALSVAAATAVAVFIGIRWAPRLFQETRAPIFSAFSPFAGAPQGKIYQVRFSIQQPGARAVALLGDFNQWQKLELQKGKENTFSAELILPEGTYAYGFLIDGKKWVPDPTGHRIVPDGFGNYNSLINL